MKRFYSSILLLLGVSLALASCVKQANDLPPDTTGYDPKLPVNISIRDLKEKNNPYSPNGTGDDTLLITEDLTAYGIVIANDQSGNIYKQIVIQDSTGGIAINIDDNSLYALYPVGRKVYVKLQGMMLSYNAGTPVLGGGVDERKGSLGLSGQQVDRHIVKANVGNPVQDTVVNFDDIRNYNEGKHRNLLNRLVTIQNVQFVDTAKSYTDPTATTNRNIQTCATSAASAVVPVRTSNYAKFHGSVLPSGNGTISGVYTVYVNTTGSSKTAQLLIRDTTDVKFTNPRCTANTPPPSTAPIITLDSLRRMYTGTGIKLGSYRVKGTVISDPANGNPSGSNIVIQDGNRGIVVYYGTTQNYSPGDSLLIDVTGDSLILYRGALELKIVGGSTTTKVATGRTVTPQIVTTAMIASNYSILEWTLVQVQNATVDGGGTYSGNKTLRDATGTVTLYTASNATFAQQQVPTMSKSFTGIISQYITTKQLQMRSIQDVQ